MKAHLLLLSFFGILNAFQLTDKFEEENVESLEMEKIVKFLRKPEKENGLRPRLANRIIRGQEAVEHSKPWIASLRINGSHFCGGSLIDEEYVLTTAHCLNLTKVAKMVGATPCSEEYMLPQIDVVLGDHYVNTTEPEEQVFGIADFKVLKPDTNRSGVPLLNDVAVLKLNRKATLNRYVSTIRLADPYVEVSPGDELTVAGWGSSKHSIYDPKLGHSKHPEKFSNVLKEAKMMVITREECANYYHAKSKWGIIHFGHPAGEDMICTREKNNQGIMSTGDYGNPLMYYNQTIREWLQIGIYSYRWGRKTENAFSYVPHFILDIEEMKIDLSYE